jgi:hypothetical protein
LGRPGPFDEGVARTRSFVSKYVCVFISSGDGDEGSHMGFENMLSCAQHWSVLVRLMAVLDEQDHFYQNMFVPLLVSMHMQRTSLQEIHN